MQPCTTLDVFIKWCGVFLGYYLVNFGIVCVGKSSILCTTLHRRSRLLNNSIRVTVRRAGKNRVTLHCPLCTLRGSVMRIELSCWSFYVCLLLHLNQNQTVISITMTSTQKLSIAYCDVTKFAFIISQSLSSTIEPLYPSLANQLVCITDY